MRLARRFSLLEVLIASTMLAGLMALALGAVQTSAQPIVETTLRAEVFTQARSRLNDLAQTLEGSKNGSVGAFSGSTFTAGSDQHTGADEVYVGRAIELQRVTGYTAGNNPPETLEGATVYAFVADGTFRDAAATPKLKLVRVLPSGLQVTVLTNVPQQSAIAAGSPPTSSGPHFWLTAPSELEVRFSIWREVAYDRKTQQVRYTQVEFVRKIQLRNVF